jgi:hypothetical protein
MKATKHPGQIFAIFRRKSVKQSLLPGSDKNKNFGISISSFDANGNLYILFDIFIFQNILKFLEHSNAATCGRLVQSDRPTDFHKRGQRKLRDLPLRTAPITRPGFSISSGATRSAEPLRTEGSLAVKSRDALFGKLSLSSSMCGLSMRAGPPCEQAILSLRSRD